MRSVSFTAFATTPLFANVEPSLPAPVRLPVVQVTSPVHAAAPLIRPTQRRSTLRCKPVQQPRRISFSAPKPKPESLSKSESLDSFVMGGLYPGFAPRSTVLNTTVRASFSSNAPGELRVTGLNDNQADICVVPDTRFFQPGFCRGRVLVNTASDSHVVATHIGRIRYAIENELGQRVTTESTAFCIPSQPDPIFGTNTMKDGVFFDSARGNCTCTIGDVTVPVPFDKRYSFEVITQLLTHIPAGQKLRIAEYFGGVGCASTALQDIASPVAYFDKNDKLLNVFADMHPDVALFSELEHAVQSDSFMDVASTADVSFIGAPCNHHFTLNNRRQENGAISRMSLDALALFKRTNNKIGVFEFVPNFATVANGAVLGDFCGTAVGYDVFSLLLDARQCGGV